jgi:hypothetical protein
MVFLTTDELSRQSSPVRPGAYRSDCELVALQVYKTLPPDAQRKLRPTACAALSPDALKRLHPGTECERRAS